jgi:hypothetical protein
VPVRISSTKRIGNGFLPKRPRGYQSAESDAKYREQLDRFCALIQEIESTMDFKVGSRGWCYILERHGLKKGDFGAAQRLINDCRKSGDLPLDICAEDESRAAVGIERLDGNNVPDEVESWVDYLRDHAHENYTPVSFWKGLPVYVEVAVEKLDLRNLFEPVCAEFHVPLTNFKGWADLNSRAAMMHRFERYEFRRCVLLLCGDHDPGGLRITDTMHKMLLDMSKATGWNPRNLIVSRFGLNEDFIDDNNLTWIDNLETSSRKQLDDPNHDDHNKAYVQDYIELYGARKCEANALVVEPELGRQLCRDAILEHVPADAPQRYQRKLTRVRNQLRKALRERVS